MDGIITDGAKITGVLEIEEHGNPGFSPGRLLGKVFQTIIAPWAISPNQTSPFAKCEDSTFIQIVCTDTLPPRSHKVAQYANIEADIRAALPLNGIADYHLIAGTTEEFSIGKQRDQLIEVVRKIRFHVQ